MNAHDSLIAIALVTGIAGWILLSLCIVVPRFRWDSFLELFIYFALSIEIPTAAASPLQVSRHLPSVYETCTFWTICAAPWLILTCRIVRRFRPSVRANEPGLS